MISKILVKTGTYRDSITLMKVSNEVSKMTGVSQAAVVMATPLNKKLLADVGFSAAGIGGAGTNDLIVAVEARSQAALEKAMAATEKLLSPRELVSASSHNPRSLAEAVEQMPGANLALISVPGQFAKREAMKALEKNLNVFLFSSNVSKRDELELKLVARKKNLLMMGPDCGTSIINHTVLGFGNVVREGTIGLVSASGTGLQEVSTLIHKAGFGISQAIGTGGGDLSDEVGGITTMEGIALLEEDESTKTIVVISKPPGRKTGEKIKRVVEKCRKPVVLNLLGSSEKEPPTAKLRYALTLEEAAGIACELSSAKAWKQSGPMPGLVTTAESEISKLNGEQKFVRGLFAGGTLCYEAQVILQPLLGGVHSNVPIEKSMIIGGIGPSKGNTCVDMGADEFVAGRPHPMMDFTMRKRRILQEARDPEVAVILLDVELGFGSNPDPASELVSVIREAKASAGKVDRHLAFVASIVGTESDFQGLEGQKKRLEKAGTLVARSNAEAAWLAAFIACHGRVR